MQLRFSTLPRIEGASWNVEKLKKQEVVRIKMKAGIILFLICILDNQASIGLLVSATIAPHNIQHVESPETIERL